MSRFSHNLVVYYWHFRVKVIRFLSLHRARKVYNTVNCLLPTWSFPAQSQLHNVRDKQSLKRFSHVVVVSLSGQMTDWLSYVSFRLSLWSGWCFVNTGFVCSNWAQWCQIAVFGTLFSLFRAVIEHLSAWWVVWCLDRLETVLGSAFLLLLCSLHHTGFTPGPNDGLNFFFLF